MDPLGAVGVVVAVIIAGGGFVLAWLNNGVRLMKRVDELTSQIFKLQDEASELRREAAACRQRESDLKAEVVRQSNRIRSLESAVGLELPEMLPGVVVANLKGVIRVFSPTLTPMLRWLPREIEGKSIEVLMPADALELHRPAFARAVTSGIMPDPDRPLLTYAQDKSGNRVPIEIRLSGWKEGNEGLITALIRQRAGGESGILKRGANP